MKLVERLLTGVGEKSSDGISTSVIFPADEPEFG